MKIIIFILFFISVFTSCNRVGNQIVQPVSVDEIKRETNDLDAHQANKEVTDMCIFDQSTQTDDFLKGIEELKGYVWDNNSKTAIKELSEDKVISIYREGCDELFLETTIILNNKNEFSNELINQNIIKIAKLFPNEYEEALVKDCLNTNCLSITKESPSNYYGNFMRYELYELLTVYVRIENNKIHITLGTYL
ncbi:hypothetical protein [Pseudofulvibacter geojedonensis]|uniref:Lipoprotein n=1 Tax=Pseudofulvibacter geojedonensis TaxID=1123758 RepID=A0ABW3I3F7_9FLAO